MTLKNNRSSLLCHIKLWASFQSHRWIQTGVTARKRSIWEKISDFFVPCDLEISWMTLKNNRAPLLCCFKLCASFHSHRCIETSYSPEHPQFGPKSAIFVLCDLEIWRMTLKNNRAPLLRYFKLCASFRSHWWIGVTAGNAQFGSKSTICWAAWLWNLTDDLEKQ